MSATVAWDEPKRGVGRPAGQKPVDKGYVENISMSAAEVRAGVGIGWLATVFRMDSRTVNVRLAEGRLKPLGKFGPKGTAVYDFGAACTLLAKPPMDQFARYMRTLRVQDMPTHLQESYWGALRKKQLWEMHAGELWKSSDVLDVLGETFQVVKNTIQLWTDNLDDKGDMSDEQRAALTQMADGLLEDIHERLVEMPRKRKTGSSLDDPDANPDNPARDDDEDLIG